MEVVWRFQIEFWIVIDSVRFHIEGEHRGAFPLMNVNNRLFSVKCYTVQWLGGRVIHDKIRAVIHQPLMSFVLLSGPVTELKGDFFKTFSWQSICKMLFFFSLCPPRVPPLQCLVALVLDDTNIWILDMWTFILQTMWNMHLNFSGCSGLTLNGQEQREMLLLNSLKSSTAYLWKSTTEVCRTAGLPSCIVIDRCFSRSNPDCPSTMCCSSLHCGSASERSTDMLHFHRLISHCIFYIWSMWETYCSIRTDFNEWMFMYSITYCCASLLYPSMMGTRRSRLRSTWFGDLKKTQLLKTKTSFDS